MDEEDPLRCLDHSPWCWSEQDFGYTLRQAVRIRFLFPMQTRSTLVVERLDRGLERDWLFQVLRDIPYIAHRWIPNAREIRFAIGQPRRGRRKIHLPVRSARQSGGWNVRPPCLRKQRSGHLRENEQRRGANDRPPDIHRYLHGDLPMSADYTC